jgi:hypothetical protein
MKKTLLTVALLAGTISAYSQGTVVFSDGDTDMTIHIFAPQLLTPSVEITGDQGNANGTATGGVSSDLYFNNAADGGYAGGAVAGTGATGTITTGGTTVYTGGAIGNTLSGFATPAGNYNYNNGSDYTVELYAAPGYNVAASALSPVTQYVQNIVKGNASTGGTFKTASPSPDNGIPNTTGNQATIMLVAWWNDAGTITSYAAALAGTGPVGQSPTDNITALGGLGSGTLSTPQDMQGLESFSLVIPTPEPSTIALGVIGASTLLFRRRK